MRGRKPKPTNLKLVTGNPGKRMIEGAEPQPESKKLPAPSWLTTEAKAEWNRVMPELVRWGLFSKLDRAAFAAYCDAVATMKYAREQLKTGFVTKSPNGYPLQSPWLAILNKSKEQIRAFASEFGLTPVARVRLKGTAQGDLFDGWTAGDDEDEKTKTGWDALTG